MTIISKDAITHELAANIARHNREASILTRVGKEPGLIECLMLNAATVIEALLEEIECLQEDVMDGGYQVEPIRQGAPSDDLQKAYEVNVDKATQLVIDAAYSVIMPKPKNETSVDDSGVAARINGTLLSLHKTAEDYIPRFERRPAGWTQPKRKDIFMDDQKAYMHESDFKLLMEYNNSYPSGTAAGKMWKRTHSRGVTWLAWYGHESNGLAPIERRLIEIIPF